jgi:hypothetical protein
VAYKDPEKKKATEKAYRERNRERVAAVAKAWYERNREQALAVRKAWRERNREQKAAADKAWRERNRERKAAVAKAWAERNRERKAETDKAWRELNRERAAAVRKAWAERNPERAAAASKAWRERNPERVAERGRRRRCRERNASIHLTANENQQLLILERTRQELQRETGREYHIDHILPIIHGGIHHPLNLRILEGSENQSKNAKLLPEAIALAPDHFRLYTERVSPERAWEFVRQLADGLGLGEDDLDALITGKPLKSKPTLEDFFT